MNLQIAAFLVQDGLINGAIYALLAFALVLVFTVTRIIFIPQGEFVAFGALTLASLEAGQLPGTVWFLLLSGAVAVVLEGIEAVRRRDGRRALRGALLYGLLPGVVAILVWYAAAADVSLFVKILLTLLLVVPLGPILYRIVFQPVADASVLVLLIVAVALHFMLTGLALLFFGAEGSRTAAFTSVRFDWGGIPVSGQSLWVFGITALLMIVLFLFFARSMYGKALMATAVNRTGAKLMGISTAMTGVLAFTLAALIGALSGILIGPITTIFYDTGFIIALKGFVAAIIGGLLSFPLAALGALLVGLLESFSSFWASAYKDIIVFALIIPVLLWRSRTTVHHDEDE